jgi:hypothetical protein
MNNIVMQESAPNVKPRRDRMKKLGIVLLVFAACAQEAVVEKPPAPQQAAAPPPEATAPPAVTGPKLAFVDEASNDPSFSAYREQLLTAVRARDTKRLLALSDPNVRTTFGGDGDAAGLERMLSEDLWRELEQILTLGGAFREGMFWAPYVYSNWPEPHDAFESLAVIADDVPLRESADANARAIATLSRDIVTRVEERESGWTKVTTADGKTGFVESKSVRSPVGYRAGFTKSPDGWRMNAIVAGD